MPPSDQTIAIPLFENATFEPLLEKRVSESFKETFLKQGWRVVVQSNQAPLTLSGRVIRFDKTPISLNRIGQAQEYRITIGLEYMLLPKKGDRSQQKDHAEASAEYIANPDPISDRVAQDRAIREAGQHLAERVADRINVVPLSTPPPEATDQ
jgi:outer membrane lipopolysaccharide assembly protein LptE/RlpB